MFKTLAAAGVNIEMISTSEVKVSCVIEESDGDKAIQALCQAFEVNNSPVNERLKAENAPPVRGVALDLNQAQVAIRYVPDRPGMAACIFEAMADHNISVDMIIQSQRCRIIDGIPKRDIAFTISQGDAKTTEETLKQLAIQYDFGEVIVNTDIAKVSIVGSGMDGQPGVAAKFFEALAKEQINIQMIATSEIKISCVVPQTEGQKALKVVHDAFELAGQEKVTVPA